MKTHAASWVVPTQVSSVFIYETKAQQVQPECGRSGSAVLGLKADTDLLSHQKTTLLSTGLAGWTGRVCPEASTGGSALHVRSSSHKISVRPHIRSQQPQLSRAWKNGNGIFLLKTRLLSLPPDPERERKEHEHPPCKAEARGSTGAAPSGADSARRTQAPAPHCLRPRVPGPCRYHQDAPSSRDRTSRPPLPIMASPATRQSHRVGKRHSPFISQRFPKTQISHASQYVSFLLGKQSCVTPWSVALQAPLSMGFSRQEHWSGLPFPSPGIFLTQG